MFRGSDKLQFSSDSLAQIWSALNNSIQLPIPSHDGCAMRTLNAAAWRFSATRKYLHKSGQWDGPA